MLFFTTLPNAINQHFKMKYSIRIVIFCILFSHTYFTQAQDSYNPWSVGLGVNAVNNPISGYPNQEGIFKTWNQDAAGFKLTGARYIKSGFVFQTDISLNTITESDEISGDDLPYISMDGIVKYNFNSKLAQINMFDPYVGVGGGYTWLDEIGAGTLNATVGLNIWLSDHFGFNLQSAYKHAFKEYGIKHFQHSGGIVFKFGGIDSDNDGIFDNEDDCPKEFGLIQFSGCPDTDEDGVEDSFDECPDIPGLPNLKGCPDMDGDGIADKDDLCPELKGKPNTKGCPDKDNDGTPDKYDACPDAPGSIKNRGCPWKDTDKDGVLDKNDKCPNQIGPVNNNGCPYPKLSQVEKDKIDAFAKTILFDLGKANLKKESKATLDNVVKIMKKYPNEKFYIAGHSDNTFTKEYNLTLSKDRANNVRDYLISKGINANRLTAEGFGEDKPITTNETVEGRQQNRRVEILLVK